MMNTAPPAETAESLLARLPFPVAYPLYWAGNPRGQLAPSECIQTALFATYQAYRLASHVLLAAYLWRDTIQAASGLTRDEGLLRIFATLASPYWSSWNEVGKRLVDYWNRADTKEQCPAPALRDGLNSIRTKPRKGSPLLDLIRGRKGPGGRAAANSLFEAVWGLRNELAHRTGAQSEETRAQDEQTLAWLLPAVTALIEALFPAHAPFTLLHRLPDGGIVRLMGAHPDRTFPVEDCPEDWESVLDHESSAMAALCGAHMIPLRPLGDTFGEPVPGHDGMVLEPAALLEAISRRHLVMMGVQGCEIITPEHPLQARFKGVQQWLEQRLVRLEIAVADATLNGVADVARYESLSRLQALTGRKYLPEFYVERAGMDDALPRFAGGGKQAMVLRGQAGSGKSSLLVRFAQHLIDAARTTEPPAAEAAAAQARALADSSTPIVIFLSGGQDFSDSAAADPDLLLLRPIARALGLALPKEGGAPSLARVLCEIARNTPQEAESDPRPIWLLLDGINESPRFTELVEALDRFLPHLAQDLPGTRLILSLRDEAYAAALSRLARAGSIFSNGHLLAEFSDGQSKPEPYLMLRPFRPEPEGRDAFERCRAALPGTAFGYDALPPEEGGKDAPSLRQLLLNPLHLYLFHYAYRGAAMPPGGLSHLGLMDAYLEALVSGVRGPDEALASPGQLDWTLLDELARYMLAHRTALLPDHFMFSLDEDWLRANRLRSLAAATSLSPLERLVDLSILIRPSLDRRDYAFVHQALAEALLLRHLGAPLPASRILELAPLTERADGGTFPELANALGEAAARLVKRRCWDGLGDLLTIEARPAYTTVIRRLMLVLLDAPEAETVIAALDARLESEPHRAPRLAAELLSLLRDLLDRTVTGGLVRLAQLAERSFGQAIASAPSRALMRDAVRALHIGADLQGDLGETAIAKEKLLLALAVAERLIKEKPDQTKAQGLVAGTLNRLGDLAERTGAIAEARDLFTRSLEISETLTLADPNDLDFQRALVASLVSLGDLARAAGATDEARDFFTRSLAIDESLIRADPSNLSFQRAHSLSLERLADLARKAGAIEEARSLYKQSLAIDETLTRADPSNLNFQRALTVPLERLGDLAQRAGALEEARGFFQRCHEITGTLSRADPSNLGFQRDLSVSLGWLGRLAREAGAIEEARGLFMRSLAITETLTRADPTNLGFQRDLSASLDRLGDLARKDGAIEEARGFFARSLAIRETLARANPNNVNFQHALCASLMRFGGLAQQAGTIEEARGFYTQCLAIRETLTHADPSNLGFQRDLSVALGRLGDLSQQADAMEEAHGFFMRSLAIDETLIRANPSNLSFQHSLSESLDRLGELAQRAGAIEEARAFFTRNLTIHETLVRANPSNLGFQHSLSVSLVRLGELAQRAGAMEEARGLYARSLAITEALTRADPTNVIFQRSLFIPLDRLGSLAQQAGAIEEARGIYKRCHEIVEALTRTDATNTQFQNDLACVKERLGGLAPGTKAAPVKFRWLGRLIGRRSR